MYYCLLALDSQASAANLSREREDKFFDKRGNDIFFVKNTFAS